MRTILPFNKNGALRKKAHDIPLADIKNPRIKKLIREMKQLLAEEEYGVALAAPQVGEPLRLFIISGRRLTEASYGRAKAGRALARGTRSAPVEPVEKHDEVTPHRVLPDQVYINPKLLKVSRTKRDMHEGCLSIRGKWGTVPRAEKATIQAYDERGQKILRGASGFLAHVFQHEIDHLEGILYTDRATKMYNEETNER